MALLLRFQIDNKTNKMNTLINIMKKLFFLALLTFAMLPLTLGASCSKPDNPDNGKKPDEPQEQVPGLNISGAAYDWTVTNKPERPYMLSYHDKMLMKFFMASKNVGGGTSVRMTFADALENIKAIDNITRGMEKIVYLVGWQYDGHDSKYPAMAEVNPSLKRPEDATARDSFLWLQKEARKYNTYVSIHTNINDAYEDSPVYYSYLRNDLLVRNADGSLWSTQDNIHKVVLSKEWRKGWLQKRIDDVTSLLNLTESKTVHLDVFLPEASPYHGISREEELEVLRKVVRYWHDKGVDITVETWHNLGQRTDPMFGLIPAVWWNDMSKNELATISPSMATGGRIFPGWDYYDTYPGPPQIQDMCFLFGENMHGEDIVFKETDFDKFQYRFCVGTLPWAYFNTHKVLNYDQQNDVVTYSDNLVVDAKARTVTKNGVLMRKDNDMLFPAVWVKDNLELIAYSENGYSDFTWTLPSEWKDVKAVKARRVKEYGLSDNEAIEVVNGTITLTVNPKTMLSIVPSE